MPRKFGEKILHDTLKSRCRRLKTNIEHEKQGLGHTFAILIYGRFESYMLEEETATKTRLVRHKTLVSVD